MIPASDYYTNADKLLATTVRSSAYANNETYFKPVVHRYGQTIPWDVIYANNPAAFLRYYGGDVTGTYSFYK